MSYPRPSSIGVADLDNKTMIQMYTEFSAANLDIAAEATPPRQRKRKRLPTAAAIFA
jgi:hypothetical protein